MLLKKLEREKTKSIQLFRERLLEKAHATIPKGRYCGWFWVDYSSKEFERMAREATAVCLRVLKESNKSRFDSYSVRNSVLISSHITFRNYRMHIFSDDLSRNSLYATKEDISERRQKTQSFQEAYIIKRHLLKPESSLRSLFFIEIRTTNISFFHLA